MNIFDFSKKIIISALLLGCVAFSSGPAETAAAKDINGLIEDLRSHDRHSQMQAVEALESLKDPMAVDALLDFVFIAMEDWRVKVKAIRVLGEIPDPEISDRLVTLFNDPFLNEECPAMKWHTALALGKDFNKGSRAVESLIEALDYNNLLVREGIIQSLGKIKDARAVPFLIPALKNKSFAIRMSAVKALENIGDPQAIPHLRQIADNDRDAQIKEAAISALRSFGAE